MGNDLKLKKRTVLITHIGRNRDLAVRKLKAKVNAVMQPQILVSGKVLAIVADLKGADRKKWTAVWAAMPMNYRCELVDDFVAASQQLKQAAFQWILLEDEVIAAHPKIAAEWVQRHSELAVIIIGKNILGVRSWMVELNAHECVLRQELSVPLLQSLFQQALLRKNLEQQLKEAQDELAIKQVQLETLAHTDTLTHLGNRFFFYQTATTWLAMAEQTEKKYALLYLNLSNFKQINECYGHLIGDEVLLLTAQRLHAAIPRHSLLARLGGDEFVVLTDFEEDSVQAYGVAQTMVSAIKETITVGGHQLRIQGQIGIATFPEVTSVQSLLRCAEMALDEAKTKVSKINFYTKRLENQHRHRMTIESYLAHAFKQQEFYVVY